MINSTSKLVTYNAADGRRLIAHVWNGQASTTARAVFLHGISSHAGWYGRCNGWLAAAGIEVHFLNRRGSGEQAESRGDIDHWETWIDDVTVYLRELRAVAERPIALCGISWGGKLAAAVARRYAELIDSVALICPGLYSSFEPGLFKQFALRTPVPRRIQRHRLVIPLRDPALFTNSSEWQTFIADDALTLRHITWRFASEDRTLTRYARQAAPSLDMRLLLMLAGRDRIIDNRRVLDFYERVPSADKTLIEYPDAAHTLEFEPDPQPYFADLANWLCSTRSCLGVG